MLEEYKSLFAGLAGFVTIAQMFSGVFLCKDIYKAGSTVNFPATPFVGGTVISLLFMQHGKLLKDDTIGFVNFFGIGLNLVYVAFYLAWSKTNEKKSAVIQLAIGAGVVAVLLGYVQIEDAEKVQVRFGSILTVMLVVLIAGPLFQIKTILREKNTDCIPFPMVVSGLCMCICWTLYGISANQPFVVYQNLFNAAIMIPQLVLCLMYPSSKKDQTKAKKT